MIHDYSVNVAYRNRETGAIEARRYPFEEYCLDIGYSLKRTLRLVEDAFQDIQNDKSKEDWSEDVLKSFQRIRGALLDNANNIERLPQTLSYKGRSINSLSGSEHVAQLIGE